MSDATPFVPEPQGEEESLRPDPAPLSRRELLAKLSSLRTDLQRDLDHAEMLAERLRAGFGDSEEVAALETIVADELSPALRKICMIEEGAFFKGAR
jgi:hypothetical protein